LQRVKESVELREHGVEAVRATLDLIAPELSDQPDPPPG
jgi:hypothetical protein